MIKQVLMGSMAALLAFTVQADNGEAEVKKAVEASLGKTVKVDNVREAGFLGLYEVQVGGDILYTDRKAGYLLIGDVVDAKSRRNLTEERKNRLAQIKFSDLPLELAVKQVRGNGKRIVATFEDPNCGYCRKLAQELQGVNDVTIYTFLYPILSSDSADKAKAIWCAPDRAKAWNDLMIAGTAPASASGNCDGGTIDKVTALGRKLNIRGTPTIFFSDGSRIPGYVNGAQIEQRLGKPAG